MGGLANLTLGCLLGALGGIYIGSQLSQDTKLFKCNKNSKKSNSHMDIRENKKIELLSEETENLENGDNDNGDNNDNDLSEEDYLSDEDDEDVGILVNSKELNDIGGEVRMALIVRTDLGMLKGKSAAQCSHAAVSLYKQMSEEKNLRTGLENESYNPIMLKRWYNCGQAKIVLKSGSLDEMEELMMKAVSLNINNYLVVDAGRTQIASGSATVLGLGPAPREVLDLVTGDLKLY